MILAADELVAVLDAQDLERRTRCRGQPEIGVRRPDERRREPLDEQLEMTLGGAAASEHPGQHRQRAGRT